MPGERSVERGLERPARPPTEAGAGFGTVETQRVRFVTSRRRLGMPRCSGQLPAQALDDPPDGVPVLTWPEVPRRCDRRSVGDQPLGEDQVPRERIEYM